jgi:hypothetical protein
MAYIQVGIINIEDKCAAKCFGGAGRADSALFVLPKR